MFRERNLVVDSSSEIVDYSTVSGRIKLGLSRIQWQHVLIGLAIVSSLAFCAIVAERAQSVPEEILLKNDLRWTNSIEDQDGVPGFHLNFLGDSRTNGSVFLGLTQPWWDVSKVPIHLKVRRAIVNASYLIHSLDGSRNVESIDIEAIAVIGQYSPVFLPDLKDFNYNYIGVDTSGYDYYRQPEKLKEILFFEKVPFKNSSSWDLKKDLLNIGVNVSVTVGSKKLITINRVMGTIKLNVNYAWEILQNVKGFYDKLALVSCPWSVGPESKNLSLPVGLKYLNLFNITKPLTIKVPMQISQILNKENMNQLQVLILYHSPLGVNVNGTGVESFEIKLSLSDLPTTLERISFRGINLFVMTGTLNSSLNVVDLTLDSNNLTQAVVDNFETIFGKVKIVRLFNLKGQPENQLLLSKILKIPTLETVWVTGFDWTVIEGDGQEVRNILGGYGLTSKVSNFEISKINSTLRAISDKEADFERYLSLGFQDISDHIEHYPVTS